MNDKPTKWSLGAAIIGFLIGIAWTTSAYHSNPNEFPFEPFSLAIASLISLMALIFWKKPKEETNTQDKEHTTIQNADNIYNIDHIDNANFS